MIDTKELRLGNWINIPICGINAKVDVIGAKKVCIDLHEVDLESGDSSFEANDIDPIPLTEEWLLKMGFKIAGISEWHYELKISAISLVCRKNGNTFYFQFENIYLGDIFKFVHQIQNFCYSLGKELEINHGN